jgi:predicted dehydrogenase
MTRRKVRIGIIGAGENTRRKHLPNLQKIDGVEVAAVCNRRRESTKAVAEAFGIPRACAHWSEIVGMDDVDAVVIGTWPYLHCEATCAALEAGKHVLCEARMAMNAREAHRMLDALRRTTLVGQIVPSPVGLRGHAVMVDLLAQDYVGRPCEVCVRSFSAAYLDPTEPMHWRQDEHLSGLNVLTLGIFNETVQRWLGDTTAVQASARNFVPERTDPVSGERRPVRIPDSIAVLAAMECGARAVYHMSGAAMAGGEQRIEIYGSRGVLHYLADTDRILGCQAGETALTEMPIGAQDARGWTVEEDFIASIRRGKRVELTSFEDGVKYMEFTEAAHLAAAGGCAVALPLRL